LGGRNISQVNVSTSHGGVLRGMHYHEHQTDYWYIAQGAARVAVFDPSINMNETRRLKQGHGLIIPAGVAHGFLALSNLVLVYGVTREYDHDEPDEHGFHPFTCGIAWGAKPNTVTLSQRDQDAPSFT
jgi:dTDP-4-dehydrorhamnose 3,5-epimerase